MKVKSTVCVFAAWYCEAAALVAVTEQVVATALWIVAVPLLYVMLQLAAVSVGSTPFDETEVKEIAPAPEPPRVVTVIGVLTLAVVIALEIVKAVV